MLVDERDMISVTDAGRSVGRLVTEAMDGRTFVLMKNNRPAAVLVGTETMERLQRMDEIAQDLRLLAIATVRSLTDSGERYTLDEVAREFGVDLDEE